MVYKGTLSAENFFAENYKLIKLFLSQQPEFKPSYSSRYAEPGEAKPIPSLLQPKKTSKRLECEGNSIYGEPSFFTVNIDFEKKLVNYSSEDIIEFNDTSIKYKLIKIIAHIKRTTGKYTWSLNDKIIASGTCTIVEKNAF
jgi:hypothetical protein